MIDLGAKVGTTSIFGLIKLNCIIIFLSLSKSDLYTLPVMCKCICTSLVVNYKFTRGCVFRPYLKLIVWISSLPNGNASITKIFSRKRNGKAKKCRLQVHDQQDQLSLCQIPGKGISSKICILFYFVR